MPKKPQLPSTAARLHAWIRAFTARPDLHIEEHKRGPTWKGAHTAIFEPRELDAFYTENNGYALRWRPSKKAADSEGGILRIPKRSGNFAIWHKDPGHREVSPYLEGMIVDEPTGELTTLVLHRYIEGTRKKERVIASDNASSNSARYFASFAAYLEEGARKAFTWYWPWYEAGEGLVALRERSLPAGTPGEVITRILVERGLSEAEAGDLCAWLGDDARLLVERP